MVDLNSAKYDNARSVIRRYLELCPHENAERIHGALVVASRSIFDIKSQLEAFDRDNPKLPAFYQLVIKIDCLIGAAEHLCKELLFTGAKNDLRKWLDGEWGADLGSVKRFRMVRSLAIAHPMETNRYPDLGVGKKDGIWCEDVLPRNSFRGDDGDYVLVLLKPENAFGERFQVSVEEDFVVPTNCALDALERLGKAVSVKLQRKIAELSETPLRASVEMPLQGYIATLKKDLAERYPSKVERIIYKDGFVSECSILDQAEQLLFVSFADECAAAAYEGYRDVVKEALYGFANALQKMALEDAPDAEDALSTVLNPSRSGIASLCDIEDVHYCIEKVFSYLGSSEGRSIESAQRKLIDLEYSGCRASGACTNEEWGIIQLFRMSDAVRRHFPLTFDATDAELYCQACAAAFYSSNEIQYDLGKA